MFAKLRILLLACLGLLVLALLWRAFLYSPPPPPVPEPAPQPIAVATPEEAPPADLVLDLFSPTDGMLAAQIAESTLTRQIDEAITINFLLRRCEFLSARDYADTYRALVAYAYKAGLAPSMAEAEQRVRGISETASASYSLIYSRTPCTDPQLPAAHAQLRSWRHAMLND